MHGRVFFKTRGMIGITFGAGLLAAERRFSIGRGFDHNANVAKLPLAPPGVGVERRGEGGEAG